MGRKVFVSYKYADSSVKVLPSVGYGTTVRHYVDVLQEKLSNEYHINKGEKDGEDLSNFANSTIKSKLRDKIYDSSITMVLISSQMRENNKEEHEQWIPWEISYSLRKTTRNDRISRRNGILAIVLPDKNGNYDYMLERKQCCLKGCIIWHREKLFQILRGNMFNVKEPMMCNCNVNNHVYQGFASYIHMIRWCDFLENINYWIDIAANIQSSEEKYDIKINF